MSSLVKIGLYDTVSNRYEEPRMKDNKKQVSSDDSLLNQTTIINKLNNIEESLTTETFNGSFGNLLNGTIALDAFGPVVDVPRI